MANDPGPAQRARPQTPEERVAGHNEFFGAKMPGLVGLRFTQVDEEAVVGHFPVTEPMVAGTGFVFAPAIVTMADTLCAAGVFLHAPDGTKSFTTVESKANFVASTTEGDVIDGRATITHAGRTTQVWDVVARSRDRERDLALFRCTQMLLR